MRYKAGVSRDKRSHRVAAALAGVVALAVSGALLAGCEDSASRIGGGSGSGTLGAPKPKESIEQAQARIEQAVASGDCERIIELLPLSRQPEGEDAQTRCEQLKGRLGPAKPVGSESFGDAAGVIDYRDPFDFSGLLIADQDGLYHLAMLDIYLREPSVGTELAPQFDAAAKQAVEALRKRDCDAFLAIANRRVAPGALERPDACEYAENNPIAALLERDPRAKLESFGGNANYAAYGIGDSGAFYTLLMARESDANSPPGIPPLPSDAAEYSLAGAFPTNVAEQQ